MPSESVAQIIPFTLEGDHVRLEPLGHHHAGGLLAAATADPSLYQWTLIPRDAAGFRTYIDTALGWRNAGTAHAFATIRRSDNTVIGSTRLFNLERWSWPAHSPHHGAHTFDTGEIGYTWLTASAIRTPVNTEAKLLMLTHAFETWRMNSVCFCTDERNQCSAAALARIGARLEGTLRAHRMAADFTPRNTLRFSITAPEWPEAKRNLRQRLTKVSVRP
jgi:N-acetyltransferase